jgi:hypothetical protein
MANVIITDQDNPGTALILPITPAELPETNQAVVKTFNVIGAGQFTFPDGRQERHFTLAGYFPGLRRVMQNGVPLDPTQMLPHIHDWRAPDEITDQVRGWLMNKTHLRYTSDNIAAGDNNIPVYLNKYSFTKKGAMGDVEYSLEFVEWRTLVVAPNDGTDPAANQNPASGGGGSTEQGSGDDGGGDPTPAQYTVQPGDTLMQISKQFLGDSGRWNEIYDLNQDAIGDDPNLILPGQVLNIPGGTAADPNNDGYTPSDSNSNTGLPEALTA